MGHVKNLSKSKAEVMKIRMNEIAFGVMLILFCVVLFELSTVIY